MIPTSQTPDSSPNFAATVAATFATAALCGMVELAVTLLDEKLVVVTLPELTIAMVITGTLHALTIGPFALLTARIGQSAGMRLEGPALAVGIAVTIWAGILWHVALLPGDPWHSPRGLAGTLIAICVGAAVAILLTRVSRSALISGLASLVAVLAMADLTLGGADPIDRPQPSSPATGWYFLIVCDTLGARHMSTYGYDRPTTPIVDQFSETAVVFDRAIAANSWTRPSVTSLLTSAPVRSHQMDAGTGLLRSDITTIGERFAKAGYPTAAVVTNPMVSSSFGFDQGFSYFDDVLALELASTRGLRPVWLQWGPLNQALARTLSLPTVHRRRGDELNQRFFEWFDRTELPGGFVWLHYMDAHSPYYAPAGTTDFGETPADLHDTAIRYWDGAFENLVAFLKDRGVWDEATIILTSDHGEEFWEHGRNGHGKSVYDEVIHVPLMVKAPGLTPRRISTTVSLLDVAPTLVDLAGLEALPVGHQRSLGPFLAGDDTPRGPVVSELLQAHDRIRIAIFDHPWKLILRPDSGEVELYNLENDPGEQDPAAVPDPAITGPMIESATAWPVDVSKLRPPIPGADTERPRIDAQEALRALGYLDPG